MIENTKKCNECGILKDFSEFRKNKRTEHGLTYFCKQCLSIKEKKHRLKNLDKFKEYAKKYYENNKHKFKDCRKTYNENNSIKLKEYWKEYNQKNSEKRKESNKIWRNVNAVYLKEKKRIYYQNNKNLINKKKKEYDKKFLDKNPHLKAWRGVLRNTIKRMGLKKEGKTIKLLGYSALDLKNHIQKLFKENMTWDNYGEWHIDHIKPVSSFSSDTPMSIVNELNNLQPLWAKDNLKKGKSLLY